MMKKIMTAVLILVLLWMGVSFFGGIFTRKGGEAAGKVITGHRGGASLGPENSLDCIAAGLDSGASSIEIDVHITSDGEIVVCHDPTVDRTTDGKGAINDMTLEEVRSLRILDKEGNPTDQKVPTLDEVLDLIDGKVELLLEIKRTKGNNVGIEKAVMGILNRRNALSYTVIQSFDDSVLEALHGMDPDLRLEKLLFGKFWGIPVIFDGTFSVFTPEKYDYIRSFNFFYPALSASLSESLHEKGYRTRIWTLDNPEGIPQMKLDGIITDCPNLFVKVDRPL